jgi:hypothetical protein
MIYSQNGVTAENQIHVRKATSYTLADLQAVRTIVNAWDAASWAPLRSSPVTLNRIRTKALDTASSPMEDFALATPRSGGVGSNPLPGNATYCIKLATDQAGRSQRGRLYVVGVAESALSSNRNQVTTGISGLWVASLNLLMANLLAGGSKIIVLSYMHDLAWRTTAAYTVATGFVAVDFNVDSQRRRLTGRGS